MDEKIDETVYDACRLDISNKNSYFFKLKSYFKTLVVATSFFVAITYLTAGLEGFGWNPYEYGAIVKKLHKEAEKEAEQKSFVINYLESRYGNHYVKDNLTDEIHGLTIKDEYTLDTLLGTLKPTPSDWEAAYIKLSKK